MTADGSSPISSLVPIYNPPKAVTLALADGTLVPVLPPAKPVPVATPSKSIEIPTTTPPPGGVSVHRNYHSFILLQEFDQLQYRLGGRPDH